jgi:hypothetical protein
LLILGLAAVVAVGAALMSLRDMPSGENTFTPGLLFPGLAARINDVAVIRIKSDKGAFSLRRQADGKTWGVPDKAGYPAQFKKIKALVVRLARTRKVEPKTRRPERYARLGVDDAKGLLLTFEDAAGKPLAALVVGKRKYAKGGASEDWSYVRLAGEPQAWQVSGLGTVEPDVKRWLVGEILTVNRDRVRLVTLVHPDGKTVRLSRQTPEQLNFDLAGVPKGRALSSLSAPNVLGGALASLSFEDVAPVGKIDFSKAVTATFETFDGLTVSVDVVKKGDDYWAWFSARYVAPPPPAEGEKARVFPHAPKDGAAEARDISARVGGWAYKLARYKGEDLTRTLESFLQPKPTKSNNQKGRKK